MQLSPDTEAVLAVLDETIEGGLRKRQDIGVLLEAGAVTNQSTLFNEIVTAGTAVWKVYGTLRKLKPGDEGFRLIEEEFSRQMTLLREHMASMMEPVPDETLKRFDEVYFGFTQGVMRNLVDLGHDLAKIKGLQRDAK